MIKVILITWCIFYSAIFISCNSSVAESDSESVADSDETSDLADDELSDDDTLPETVPENENLLKLCKVWGYVKYYHPAVAEGTIDIDAELLLLLPDAGLPDFDKTLSNWIKNLGKLQKASEVIKEFPDAKLIPDTDWITDTAFVSESLSAELTRIAESPRPDFHHYVSLYPGVGNAEFLNEDIHYDLKITDPEFTILTLFRFWNAVEYFYPYKYLIPEDWDAVLVEYIPRMKEAQDELAFFLTLSELTVELTDTHAGIYNENVLYSYLGKNSAAVWVRFIEEKPVIYKVFDDIDPESSLLEGDVITRIDGRDVDTVIKEKSPHCSASNYPVKQREIAAALTRTNSSTTEFTVLRSGSELPITVKTYDYGSIISKIWLQNKPSHHTIEDTIGYLYPGTLVSSELETVMTEFQDKKGIIIDFRCYPADFTVFSLSEYLLPSSEEFVTFTMANIQYPGLFTYTESLSAGSDNPDFYKGRIVIIIDETTQSSAEYHTMAFQKAPDAVVIGSTTAGADGNVSEIPLLKNLKITLTGIGIYYPDKTETQQVGIIPDILIKPTIAGIIEGRDELLEKAVEIINESKPK